MSCRNSVVRVFPITGALPAQFFTELHIAMATLVEAYYGCFSPLRGEKQCPNQCGDSYIKRREKMQPWVTGTIQHKP